MSKLRGHATGLHAGAIARCKRSAQGDWIDLRHYRDIWDVRLCTCTYRLQCSALRLHQHVCMLSMLEGNKARFMKLAARLWVARGCTGMVTLKGASHQGPFPRASTLSMPGTASIACRTARFQKAAKEAING